MNKIAFIFFVTISHYSFCQVKGGNHQKLFDMYAMGKFEDCAFKAENMTMNEKYKKDPEPLLYLSMCLLKISKMDSTQLDEHYKEPLKESLKYAKKFRAKDKDASMYNNNREFFDSLKLAAIDQAGNLYNQNQYGKAAAYLAMINAFDEKDDNVRFAKGVYDMLGKNIAEGAKTINEAMNFLANPEKISNPVSEPLLAHSMIVYADFLNKNKMEDSAKKTISFAKEFFPENTEVKTQYNLMHGLPEEKQEEKNVEQKYILHEPTKEENSETPKQENKEELKEEQ